VLERGLLDERRLDAILSVDAMTKGGVLGERAPDRAPARSTRKPCEPR